MLVLTAGEQTTNQVKKISYVARNDNSFTPFSLTYAYNTRGNISSVTGTTRTDQTASYSYNAQGQLTKETNTKGTYNYSYDTYGNIRSVSGAESHTYTYGMTLWRDLLTAYDGESITYQENGNPISYYNGTRWEFSWMNGRQLRKAVSDDHTITYTYDAHGIRNSKTVDGKAYTFYTSNGQVGRQYYDGKLWTFFYDHQGTPIMMRYEGYNYYYVLNLQGDVIGLTNSSGVYVAKYAYDAWGKCISSSGTMADINPLRYRGYYYDQETGFYYLGSRYYDPEIKRFINADDPNVVFADTASLTDKNLFAYCDNNPVMRKDAGGAFWDTAIDVISLFGSVSDVIANPNSVTAWGSLAADVVSLAVPGLTGGGAIVKAVSKADDVVDVATTVNKVENVFDTSKAISTSTKNARSSAVRRAWKNEVSLVESTGKGTRNWTANEIAELLDRGKVSGYVGHHMKSVKGYPELAGDPSNIQFLTRREHWFAHQGNWRNVTHGRYVP